MKKFVKQCIRIMPFANKVFFGSAALFSRLMAKKSPAFDYVFITGKEGWILEGICRDTAAHLEGSKHFHRGVNNLPIAKVYYFSHHSLFFPAVVLNPRILKYKTLVQYTHYSRPLYLSDSDVTFALNYATAVLNMNSETVEMLKRFGVSPEKLKITYIGVDETIFYPKPKVTSSKCIGFNLRYEPGASYSSRKNYDVIVDIIRAVEFSDVILLGRNWQEYERFIEIKDLAHFQYIETSYKSYPKHYAEMDVFVSVSKLEGGPVPMLEAMFCGVFPVMSKTGFAPDIIDNGRNGLLFDVDSSVEQIVKHIRLGLQLAKRSTVRESVKHLTWKNFANNIRELTS